MRIHAQRVLTGVALAILLLVVVALFTTMGMQRHLSMLESQGAGDKNTTVVYADNNASTPPFPEALDAAHVASAKYYANASSIHGAGRESRAVIEEQRKKVAALVGVEPCEIVFTSGATESNNIIIRSVTRFLEVDHPKGSTTDHKKVKDGSSPLMKIVTTPIEHASIMQTIESMSDTIKADITPVDRYGKVNLEHFEKLLEGGGIIMACIIIANNEIGTIQDVVALSALCRKHRVHLHCDMTQMFGKYAMNLTEMRIDSATMSAHKFHGPKGVGALYVRNGVAMTNACMTGGGQEDTRRGGTENIGGVCGMATALSMCMAMLHGGKATEIREMRDYIRTEIKRHIPGVTENGHPTDSMYNTLSLSLPVNTRKLIPVLDKERIYANVGCACSQGKGSKTLQAIGLTPAQSQGSLRISLGFMNTREDCVRLVDAIVRGTRKLLLEKS